MDDTILTRVAQSADQAQAASTLHLAGTCAQAAHLRVLLAQTARRSAKSVDVRWNLVFHDGKKPSRVSLNSAGSRAQIDGEAWQLDGRNIVCYLKSITIHLVPPEKRETTFAS